jgi:hypothetical protein
MEETEADLAAAIAGNHQLQKKLLPKKGSFLLQKKSAEVPLRILFL